jgi:hypothetical protein
VSATDALTTTNNNDENANKSIDDKLKEMEKAFQLKMNLMEQQNEENSDAKDALQKELVALKQKELDQKEENRLLKERLARMEAEREDNVNDDLSYDSSNDEIDDENDINYDSECSKGKEEQDIHPTAESNVTERNNNVLQNDFTTPKQENHQQAKENQPLQGRPARMEAGVQDDANNDLNYDSASNGNDDNNDINYDSSDNENESNNDINYDSSDNENDSNNDINYDSSDNENDSNNDINYDSQCSDIEEDNANKVIPATQ